MPFFYGFPTTYGFLAKILGINYDKHNKNRIEDLFYLKFGKYDIQLYKTDETEVFIGFKAYNTHLSTSNFNELIRQWNEKFVQFGNENDIKEVEIFSLWDSYTNTSITEPHILISNET